MNRGTNERGVFEADNYFMLRAPLLPCEAFRRLGVGLSAARLWRNGADEQDIRCAFVEDNERVRERLRLVTDDAIVREALTVSSGGLAKRLDRWLVDPLGQRGAAAERAVMKYVTRGATRCTPYGLLAGVALGEFSGCKRALVLGAAAEHRRHVRADARILLAVAALVARDRQAREHYVFTRNSTLYRIGNRLRYYESPGHPFGGDLRLVSIAAGEVVERILEVAAEEATWGTLINEIRRNDATLTVDDASGFLHELVDAQVLIPNVYPSPHGAEMLAGLRNKLRNLPCDAEITALVDTLATRAEQLGDLPLGEGAGLLDKTGLEVHSFLRARANDLRADDPKSGGEVDVVGDESTNIGPCFQIDMKLSAEKLCIPAAEFDPVVDALDSLYRINAQDPPGFMRGFADAFRRRYDDREVPLCEVLDPDHGIRFGPQGMTQGEPSPLLRVPAGQGAAAPATVGVSRVDAWRAGLLLAAAERNEDEIAIMADDIRRQFPTSVAAPPESMTVIAALHQRVCGEADSQRWSIVSCWGSHALAVMGRFAHVVGAALKERLIDSAAREQKLAHTLLADVSYLPPANLGNVCQQPVFRRHTISYRCPPSTHDEHVIPLEDLVVSVSGDVVLLRSKRLGVVVTPRVDHALNAAHPTSPAVFSFLSALQYQGRQAQINWTWGQFRDLPRLPRVVIDNVIVSPRIWNLTLDDVKALTGKVHKQSFQEWGCEGFIRVQKWRAGNGVPRHVAVGTMADYLTIDLDNPLSVDLFLRQIRSQRMVRESYCGERAESVTSEAGHHVSEFVVPIWSKRAKESSRVEPPEFRGGMNPVGGAVPVAVPSLRLHDGVLYAKIYGGESVLDKLLRSTLGETAFLLDQSDAVRCWFFVRYADPDPHVRLRVFGDPEFLAGHALPSLERTCGTADGIWRLVFDAYHPEIDRYGGAIGMALAEEFFHLDSRATLRMMMLCANGNVPVDGAVPTGGVSGRWFLAAVSADRLLRDFRLDLNARCRFTKTYGDVLAEPFRFATTHRKHVGRLYRTVRHVLDEGLADDAPLSSLLSPGVERVFGRRALRIRSWLERMDGAHRADALTRSWQDMMPSFFHMHCNRIFVSQQRRQEAVLVQLLHKYYTSHVKRNKSSTHPRNKKAVAK